MQIQIGQQAPDFELTDQDGTVRKLSDYRGKQNVVLVFYPFAFSGICTAELCELRDDLSVFASDDTATLAVSIDSKFALKAFAEQERYSFPLLADFWPHGQVARLYGVFDEDKGMANRGTFILDKEGRIRFVTINPPGQPRDVEAYRKALAEL